jgi:uncharacterized protein (TIGR03083 family)
MSEDLSPSFIPLDTARRTALRELGGFVELCRSLNQDDWSRPTPCPGWSVRDLIEHVAGVPGYDYFAGRLRAARLRDNSGPSTNASTAMTGLGISELIDVLRRRAAEFVFELELLSEDDLDRELFVMPGRSQLLRSALGGYIYEFGLHHYDLASALGDAIELDQDVCSGVVLMAQTDGFRAYRKDVVPWHGATPAPDKDVSYVLIGDTVRWEFSFTAHMEPHPFSPVRNGRWTPGVVHETCCTVKGSDSAICLVLAGRISTHDRSVSVTEGFVPRIFAVW